MEPIFGSTPRSFGYPLTVVLPWRARGRLRATLSSRFTAALLSAALLWPWQPALAQFTQDGPPLVGNDVDGPGLQGSSVALSGDGSTAIVGGGDLADERIRDPACRGGVGVVPLNWSIVETGDFNGDFMSDILWRDSSSGTVATWLMNGLRVVGAPGVATVGLDWTIQGLNAD
jgi:hypothetical protein